MSGLLTDNFAGGYSVLLALTRPPQTAMILQVCELDRVVFLGSKFSRCADQREVSFDHQPSVIEKDMMVRAEAKQIFGCVRPIVRATKRADMRSFRVRPASAFQADSASLAAKIMQLLDGSARRCVADDALNDGQDSSSFGRFLLGCSRRRTVQGDKSVAAHLEAISPYLPPVAFNAIEAIISIACIGAKLLVLPTAEDTNRQPSQVTGHEGSIAPTIKLLIGNLLPVRLSTMASVDHYRAMIFVIGIPARQDDRFRPSIRLSDDPPLVMAMHSCTHKFNPVEKLSALRNPTDVSDHRILQSKEVEAALKVFRSKIKRGREILRIAGRRNEEAAARAGA
jgi:hypothetical protein